MPTASPPKQDRVYQALKQRVLSNEMQPGDRLPALREVARQFDSNLNTVYQAVRRLEHEKLVVARHGRGVFVTEPQRRTRNALLLNRIEGHMWAELTQRFIERFSAQPQHRLVVESIPTQDPGQLASFREKLTSLIDSGIDTVIFNGIEDGGIRQVFDDLPTDVEKLCVFSRSAIGNANVGGAVSDWYHGGYVAAKHLIEVGCRNLVAVTPGSGGQLVEIARGAEAAANDGLTPVNIGRFICRNFHDAPDTHTRELLAQHPQVDGILTHGDFVSAPLVRSLQAHGRRVPEDVAVVGYYDTPWAEFSHPTLTSINADCNQLSDAVVDMCLAGEFHRQVVIHPRLVVRESSRR